MLPSAFRHLFRAALVASAAFAVSAGCSRQAEGERCDLEWAGPDQDCDSTDLYCVACGSLQDDTVDRCCRRDGTYTDSRCRPAVNPKDAGKMCSSHKANEATGGTGGSGATGGSDATGGTDTGTGGTTDVPTAGMSGAGSGG